MNGCWQVLENVKGGELFDYIIAKGRLDRDLSLQMVAQIVQGLEHCHVTTCFVFLAKLREASRASQSGS